MGRGIHVLSDSTKVVQKIPKAKAASAKDYSNSLVVCNWCYPLQLYGNTPKLYNRDLLQSTFTNACFLVKIRGLPWWIDVVQFCSTKTCCKIDLAETRSHLIRDLPHLRYIPHIFKWYNLQILPEEAESTFNDFVAS